MTAIIKFFYTEVFSSGISCCLQLELSVDIVLLLVVFLFS